MASIASSSRFVERRLRDVSRGFKRGIEEIYISYKSSNIRARDRESKYIYISKISRINRVIEK